jgi:hypothetical protein
MSNIMLDLETMGNSSDSAMIAIGACYFDPKTGNIGDEFYREIKLETSVKYGGKVDSSTVIWWMGQSDDARAKFVLNDSASDILDVLRELTAFVKSGSIIWGNGSTFDNTILRNAYARLEWECPWKFWNDRGVRTIVDLGVSIGINPKEDLKFEGVPHYALDDAKHQAKYVSIIHQALTVK